MSAAPRDGLKGVQLVPAGSSERRKPTTGAITMCFPFVFKLREEGLRDRQAVRIRIVGYYYLSNQEEQEQEL